MTVTKSPSAFIAGATGYTGQALVRELRSRGIATVAHVRPDSPDLSRWRERFEPEGAVVDITPWDEEALTATLSRIAPHAVFALLGTTSARMRRSGGRDSYETVDYGLSAMLLRAVSRGAPNARFVYLSSVGVRASARGGYLRVRWRLEEEVRASGVAWTIARPFFITGPDRRESRPLERIVSPVIDGMLRLIGALGATRIRDRYSSLTASRLARGLADAAFSAEAEGKVLTADQLRS